MEINIPRTVQAKAPDGTTVTVDLSNVKMSPAEQAALQRLLGAGDLSTADRELLKNMKAQVKGDDVNTMFIVRFDWKWVRID